MDSTLLRRYLNISSNFLRFAKSAITLAAVCRITSNLLFVDFDISHYKPDFTAGFFI